MRATFGKEPGFAREGGSIGAVLTMRRLLKAPVTFLGLSLPEHGYHAVNENFDWGQAAGGMEMFCRYFHEIAGRAARRTAPSEVESGRPERATLAAMSDVTARPGPPVARGALEDRRLRRRRRRRRRAAC